MLPPGWASVPRITSVSAQCAPRAVGGSPIAPVVPGAWPPTVSARAPALSGPCLAACVAHWDRRKRRRPRPIHWPKCSPLCCRRQHPIGHGVQRSIGTKIMRVSSDNDASTLSRWDVMECLTPTMHLHDMAATIAPDNPIGSLQQDVPEHDRHAMGDVLLTAYTVQAVRPACHWWRCPRVFAWCRVRMGWSLVKPPATAGPLSRLGDDLLAAHGPALLRRLRRRPTFPHERAATRGPPDPLFHRRCRRGEEHGAHPPALRPWSLPL